MFRYLGFGLGLAGISMIAGLTFHSREIFVAGFVMAFAMIILALVAAKKIRGGM